MYYLPFSVLAVSPHIRRNYNLPYIVYRNKLIKFLTVTELKGSPHSPMDPKFSKHCRIKKALTLSSSLTSPPCLFGGRKAGTFTGNDLARLLCRRPFGM
jgi:hypothetical protein